MLREIVRCEPDDDGKNGAPGTEARPRPRSETYQATHAENDKGHGWVLQNHHRDGRRTPAYRMRALLSSRVDNS